MRKPLALVFGGIGIFLVGILVGCVLIWQLYDRGLIFNVREVPNPVIKYTTQGQYDDAIREALAGVHDEHRDYFQYNQVVSIYLTRAYKDEAHREQWVQLAGSYVDKMVSLGPSDFATLSQTAYGYDRAGDLAKNGCPYYEKATKICDTVNSMLQGNSLTIQESKYPTTELRQGNEALQRRVGKKIQAWCSNSTP